MSVSLPARPVLSPLPAHVGRQEAAPSRQVLRAEAREAERRAAQVKGQQHQACRANKCMPTSVGAAVNPAALPGAVAIEHAQLAGIPVTRVSMPGAKPHLADLAVSVDESGSLVWLARGKKLLVCAIRQRNGKWCAQAFTPEAERSAPFWLAAMALHSRRRRERQGDLAHLARLCVAAETARLSRNQEPDHAAE